VRTLYRNILRAAVVATVVAVAAKYLVTIPLGLEPETIRVLWLVYGASLWLSGFLWIAFAVDYRHATASIIDWRERQID